MTILKDATAQDPSKRQQDVLKDFEQHGYVVVKNAIDPAELEALRTHYSQVLSDPSTEKVFRPGGNDFVHEVIPDLPIVKGIIFDALVDNPLLLDFMTNERVLPVLKTILGDDFVVLPDFVVQWNYFNILHTDMTTGEQRGMTFHREPDYRIVSVGVYFQENSIHGGGLYIVPESHNEADPCVELRKQFSARKTKNERSVLKRWVDKIFTRKLQQCREKLIAHPKGIDIPSQMGDLVIFDNRILHRSSFPQDMRQLSSDGGKMAFMGSCSSNNQHAQNYIDMLNAKSKDNYLSRERDLEPLRQRAEKAGILVT